MKILSSLKLKRKLCNTNCSIVSYENFLSKPLGEIDLTCQYKNFTHILRIVVVDFEDDPLFSINDFHNFGLIKVRSW